MVRIPRDYRDTNDPPGHLAGRPKEKVCHYNCNNFFTQRRVYHDASRFLE
jgi:hypothetical protein